jgi:hypothetical protein
MSENTRKAVVTTAQVQAALAEYLKIRKENGVDDGALEFDKGFRGKGFATYKGNEVVASFETKEEAFLHYSKWVEVAKEILAMVEGNKTAEDGAAKLIAASDTPETKPTTTRRKPAEKVAA